MDSSADPASNIASDNVVAEIPPPFATGKQGALTVRRFQFRGRGCRHRYQIPKKWSILIAEEEEGRCGMGGIGELIESEVESLVLLWEGRPAVGR